MVHTVRIAAASLVLSLLALPGTLHAQDAPAHDEVRTELRDIAASPTPSAEDRQLLEGFLESSRVQGVAEGMGIDLGLLQDRVATLGSDEASDLAKRVRDAGQEAPLAGGDTFVITSTTVIIALLVIILVIVA